jgi:prevent-host-death family protein
MAAMVRIGVRRLRTELSHWIEQARRGTEVTITERGAPVARLMPLDGESPLERMIRDGLVTLPRTAKRARLERPAVRPKGGTVAEILERQRRDRPW